MSSNFFAALDEDSGDEAPAVAINKKKASVAPAAVKKKVTVQEPSIVDDRKKPAHGDRNTKYGRGGRAPVRDGKRAYDRRSGTGRGKEMKKGGGGAHNWGSDKNDAKAATGHIDEDAANAEEEVTETEVPAEEEEEAAAAAEPIVDNTMSYEEYVAAQKEKQSELLAPVEERTVDANEFANLLPKTKAEEEEFLAATGGKTKRKKAAKATTTASATELLGNLRVGGGDNSGGGGGGRGGGRGRGRGEGRGGRGGRDGGRGRGGGRGGRGRGEGRGRGRDGEGRGRGRDGEGRGRGRDGGGRGGGGGGRSGGRGGAPVNTLDPNAFPSLG